MKRSQEAQGPFTETCLLVFDPADEWKDIEEALPSHVLPLQRPRMVDSGNNESYLAFRSKGPTPLGCHVLLGLPPEGGFSDDHSLFLKDRQAASNGRIPLLILTFADEEELRGGGYLRSGPGYLSLYEEMKREYCSPPLIIPRKAIRDLAPEMITRLNRVCQRAAVLQAHVVRKTRLAEITGKHAPACDGGAVRSIPEIYTRLLFSRRSGVLLKAARELRSLSGHASRSFTESLQLWEAFTQTGLNRCAAVARKAEYFSTTADKLINEKWPIEEILSILDTDWRTPPTKDLVEWRDDARSILQTSEIVMPVVGVFSSGKTTLINMILGDSPKGRELFRTSITHNTALLCSFHAKKQNKQSKVVFSWHNELPEIKLVSNEYGERDMKRGQPVGLLSVRPRAIRAFRGFIASKVLVDGKAVVTWRHDTGPGQEIQLKHSEVKNSRQIQELFDVLLRMIEDSHAETDLLDVATSGINPLPVEVVYSASTAVDKRKPIEHLLETDEDWDWFQGMTTEEHGAEKRTTGFAESSEAEYLISQCDIYIDHPLFRQVNLVDTPGLNSITEHHDRITEVFIREGHCFVFMAKLAEAAGHKDTERILRVMSQTLTTSGISGDQAERVFLVLNWFREQAGGRTDEQAQARIREFEALACRHLNTNSPNIYVVNLLDEIRDKKNTSTMLNKPSVGQLIKDVKEYIAEKGTADRFSLMHERLEASWNSWTKALDRKRQVIAGERDPKKDYKVLQAILKDFDDDSDHVLELKKQIADEVRQLINIFDKIKARLEEINKKDEFEDFIHSGGNKMGLFNETRISLGSNLAEEVSARLNAKLAKANLDKRFRVRAQNGALNEVEPLPQDEFVRDLSGAVEKWPDFCILYSPGKARRIEFGNRYFRDEIRRKLVSATDALTESYFKELDRVHREISRELEERQDEVRLALEKREAAERELELERKTQDGFEPTVVKTLNALTSKARANRR